MTIDSTSEKPSRLIPLRYFPNRPGHPWSLWLACVVTAMALIYGFVVPLTADWPAMQTFADMMGQLIPQFEEAVAVTDFERQARVMLAFDRALVPVWVLMGLAINIETRINRNNHPAFKIGLFLLTFFPVIGWFYLYPHVPEPPDPGEYSRRNLYALMTHSLFGFTFVHAVVSVLVSASLLILSHVILRFSMLCLAHDEWCRSQGLGKHKKDFR